ncbi:hypothetical protein OUZ56_018629 [Daphnia magna]|uniref:Uncharacterized protein n=1 Tax=Daphnia magna TaxID=35525 RepID=A0ABQ9Z9B5_9CRUS|nr:hypothetical protein OUZ56_018629 [Daphnia magna]
MLFYVISYVHKNLFVKPYALLLTDYALRNCIRMAFGYVSNLEQTRINWKKNCFNNSRKTKFFSGSIEEMKINVPVCITVCIQNLMIQINNFQAVATN